MTDGRLPRITGSIGCKMDSNTKQRCNLAGDSRVNVCPSLTTYHHLFVLEHNRIAKILYDSGKLPDNETIFQEARQILIAVMQKITYEEFLPSFMSPSAMSKYGLVTDANNHYMYNNSVDASMINEFGIAYRMGHTWIPPTMDIFDRNARPLIPPIREPTEDNFNNLTLYYHEGPNDGIPGPDGLATWLTGEPSPETDRFVVRAALSFLFKNVTDQTAFDLVALNIQRGRDHGLPGYVAYLKECDSNIGDVITFNDLPYHSQVVRNKYSNLYSDVRDIDLFSGLVSETSPSGHELGPTIECILGLQFRALKKGDRFWFEGPKVNFDSDQLSTIKGYTMAKLLCNNYEFNEVNYPNAFIRTDPKKNCDDIDLDLNVDAFLPPAPTTTTTTTAAPPPQQNGGGGGAPPPQQNGGGGGGGGSGGGGGPGGGGGGGGPGGGPGGANKREKEMEEILSDVELETILEAIADDLDDK